MSTSAELWGTHQRAGTSSTRRAAQDLLQGLRLNWMWTALAFQDIKLRYRGSVLGPLWITIGSAIMIAAIGVIFPRVFRTNTEFYVPYLAIGWVLWQFISSTMQEACTTFLNAEMILQIPVPFSLHVYRVVFRHVIVFAHNAIIAIVVLVIYGIPHSFSVLAFLPGLAMLIVNAVWVSFLFGMLATRFRDIPPIVASVLQVLFLLTPVFWPPSVVGDLQPIIELNPFFAAIDVIRSPLLGMPCAPYSWSIVVALAVVGASISFAVFARVRARIPYWF